MALTHNNITVGTTATVIVSIPVGSVDTQVNIYNNDNGTIYVGNSAVSVSAGANQGFPIPKTTAQQVWLKGGDTLYGISASGTSTGAVIILYSTFNVENFDRNI